MLETASVLLNAYDTFFFFVSGIHATTVLVPYCPPTSRAHRHITSRRFTAQYSAISYWSVGTGTDAVRAASYRQDETRQDKTRHPAARTGIPSLFVPSRWGGREGGVKQKVLGCFLAVHDTAQVRKM